MAEPLDCFSSFSDSMLLSSLPDVVTAPVGGGGPVSLLHGVNVMAAGVDHWSSSQGQGHGGEPCVCGPSLTQTQPLSSAAPSYTIHGTYMLHRGDLDFGGIHGLGLGLGGLEDKFTCSSASSGTNTSNIFQFPDLPLASVFGTSSRNLGQGQSLASSSCFDAAAKKTSTFTSRASMTSSSSLSLAALTSSGSDRAGMSDYSGGSLSDFSQQQQVPYSGLEVGPSAGGDVASSSRAGPSYTSPVYGSYGFDRHQRPTDDFQPLSPFLTNKSSPEALDALTITRRRLFAQNRHTSELTLPPTKR